MTVEPVLAGPIPEDGIVSLLTEIEACRTTGVLTFKGDHEGEVSLVLGQISADQPERDDDKDAVELLLEMRGGTFEVLQRLPILPVSRGDAQSKKGSLEVHVPADLMNYCERAGLTGLLTLEFDKKLAEIIYDKGELSGIRLDGLDELHQVFGWEDGSFHVEVFAQALDLDAELEELEEEAEEVQAPAPDTTGRHFLKVVEVTLSEIIKEREERRPATRTSPPLPPMAAPTKHPTLRPPSAADATKPPKRKERRDQTVRVIYLGGRRPIKPSDKSTTHIREDVTAEVVLPAATRESKGGKQASPKAPKAPTPTPGAAEPTEEPNTLAAIGWMSVAILVVFAALGLLSVLPPIE